MTSSSSYCRIPRLQSSAAVPDIHHPHLQLQYATSSRPSISAKLQSSSQAATICNKLSFMEQNISATTKLSFFRTIPFTNWQNCYFQKKKKSFSNHNTVFFRTTPFTDPKTNYHLFPRQQHSSEILRKLDKHAAGSARIIYFQYTWF